MPIPRHSQRLASVNLAPAVDYTGVTELRVHGVGGTPPDAILGDLAPEQVWGDRVAGFYRTSDHQASPGDDDAKRHVECYSWSGLTSRSKSRVLWLALLPFLLGNLAGWMCSAKTRKSGWRFALHRAAAGLGMLALTINAVLVAVLITADILGYQAARTGLAAHQWWLAPLNWPDITGHPARQLLVGVAAVVLFVLALWLLARRSWRYEAVRPPYDKENPPGKPRSASAASLKDDLADKDFWDGGTSVRLLTWLHIASSVGFLAIVLGVTARSVGGGWSSQAVAWWWAAVCAGGAAVALSVAYTFLDAFGALTDTLRRWSLALLVPAAASLACAGVFAWLQPAGSPGKAAALPGMAGIVGWTALAIAAAVAALLVSALLGIGRGGTHTLLGGSWVTLALAFSVLNVTMLSVTIWVAHLVGPVTANAGDAASRATIYVPYVITSGVPIVVFAAVVAAIVFLAAEFIRPRLASRLPDTVVRAYQERAKAFRASAPEQLKPWYSSGTSPFSPAGDGDGKDPHWTEKIARARALSRAPRDAGWLLWGIILLQLAAAIWTWQLHKEPPLFISDAGLAIAGLLLPGLMGFLYAAWSDPARRRQIAVLFDVCTFWPRSYHPLSPPCYAERAVPDLQRRLWWLHDNDDHGSVVLVGHSQGTMLAIAALLQQERRPDGGSRASLITLGSPAGKLYGWVFPAYITTERLTPLAPGGGGHVHDWLNFYYPTDPIAGPVAEKMASPACDLVDRPLPDPADSWYVYGQPLPAPKGHSGYWDDPRVWSAINHVAAVSQPAARADKTSGAAVSHFPRLLRTNTLRRHL